MSIWSSQRCDADEIPLRENYGGRVLEGEDAGSGWVDVATAGPWHDLIRVSVWSQRGTDLTRQGEMLITTDEARAVIADLQQAIVYLDTEWPDGCPHRNELHRSAGGKDQTP